MKKLAFIVLVLVSCSGIYPSDEEIVIQPSYSSPLIITGVASSIWVQNYGLNYGTIREDYQAINYSVSPSSQSVRTSINAIFVYTIERIGLTFDYSALPDGVIVDSVFLKVYNTGDYSLVGLAIYSANYLLNLTNSDYIKTIGGYQYNPAFNLITHTTETGAGYNIIKVNSLPPYLGPGGGGETASYGIGEYEHDYMATPPPYTSNYNIELNITDGYLPELIIYYSAYTPSTKKIKIIGVI
jgi:hypothetical protein